MAFGDEFKAYSPKIRGELIAYLKERRQNRADNLFSGPRYFFVMRDKCLLIPLSTILRVNASPIPDIGYFVNSEFMLESHGRGHSNMSFMGAEKGVYNPKDALARKLWSIHRLNLR